MSDKLKHYYRIDFRTDPRDGHRSQYDRMLVKDVATWEALISLIMAGAVRHPDTNELIIFSKIVRIERVNNSVKKSKVRSRA